MVTSGRTFRSWKLVTTIVSVVAAALIAGTSADVWTVERSARANQAPNPACALLSAAEVRKITGYPDYNVSPGDPPGQGVAGGSSCQYVAPAFGAGKGPLVSLVLIEGKDLTAQNRRLKKLPGACKRELAPGIGDDAYFEVCPAPRPIRTSPLYVKAGTKDLIVQIDIEAPDTEETLRPKIIALAKAAVAKLR
jgi:hypothetical protein